MNRKVMITFALTAWNGVALAQSGGTYDLSWNSLDGGGGTSTGGTFTLRATIGQSDAGAMSGGTFDLTGGFQLGGGVALDPPGIGDDLCDGGSNAGAPCATDDDCPGGFCGLKNRYLTIGINGAIGRGSGGPTSIQVMIASMPLFPEREGDIWWAGPSQAIPNDPSPSASGAGLVCETAPSHAEVWPVGYLHLFGQVIIPGSTYAVRHCDPSGDHCSEPLFVGTGLWGDVVAPFGASSQPNFADINGIVTKFTGAASAPATMNVDLLGTGQSGTPNTPDQLVNFLDINAGVAAFTGQVYAYTVNACP